LLLVVLSFVCELSRGRRLLGAVLGAELRSGQGWPQATAGGGAAAALSATSSAQQWRPHNVRGDAGIGQATSSPTRSGRSSKIRRQAAPAPTISTRRFDNFKPVVFDQFHAAGDTTVMLHPNFPALRQLRSILVSRYSD
jgi:hypothetical protein